MTYTVVTTFHQAGYQTYAARMLQTFTENWPQSVTLLAYAENCEVVETAPNLRVIDAVTTLTDLTSFKERWKDDPRARGEVATGPVDRKGNNQALDSSGMLFGSQTRSMRCVMPPKPAKPIGCCGWMPTPCVTPH